MSNDGDVREIIKLNDDETAKRLEDEWKSFECAILTNPTLENKQKLTTIGGDSDDSDSDDDDSDSTTSSGANVAVVEKMPTIIEQPKSKETNIEIIKTKTNEEVKLKSSNKPKSRSRSDSRHRHRHKHHSSSSSRHKHHHHRSSGHRHHSRDRKRSKHSHKRSRSRDRHEKRSRSRDRHSHSSKTSSTKPIAHQQPPPPPTTASNEQKVQQLDVNGTSLTINELLKTIEMPKDKRMNAQDAMKFQMEQLRKKTEELTGVKVPTFYNANAINPLLYAEQQRKRKLLWSKSKETNENTQSVNTTTMIVGKAIVNQSQDEKTAQKFRKLMGMKEEDEKHLNSNSINDDSINKMQAKAFDAFNKEYELARMTTHTHRGTGFGFITQQQHQQQPPSS